jgi:nucleoside-diphosphate-sugar epimerase
MNQGSQTQLHNIILAGSNGFIGSHLYSQLEEHSVTLIDYGNGPAENFFINLDLTNINQVNDFADNCDHFDVLIFLVGLAHAKGKGKDLPEFKKINYQTLVNLLSALKSNNKLPNKIIFASTISVYGEKLHQNVYNEESDKNPFSPYAVTKLEAEQYLLDNFDEKSWILRFAPGLLF